MKGPARSPKDASCWSGPARTERTGWGRGLQEGHGLQRLSGFWKAQHPYLGSHTCESGVPDSSRLSPQKLPLEGTPESLGEG